MSPNPDRGLGLRGSGVVVTPVTEPNSVVEAGSEPAELAKRFPQPPVHRRPGRAPQWIYPRQPAGRFYRARTYLSWLLLGIMFAGPFIRISGNPLLLLNVVERKFIILGNIFGRRTWSSPPSPC